MNKPLTDDAKAAFAALAAKRALHQAQLPQIAAEGEAALRRLFTVAQGDSGQCRYVAHFLLGVYNGPRFPFDLTDFRALDRELFADCMTLLRMDYAPEREVHTYFENGSAKFEQLAKNWNVGGGSLEDDDR